MKRSGMLMRVFGALCVLVVTAMFAAMIIEGIWFNDDKPLTTLAPQGEFSQTIQNLVAPVFLIGIVIGVLVMLAVGYSAWRFRERPGEDPEESVPVQMHGNPTLEIGWTLLPALILLVVAVLTVGTIRDLNQPAPDALRVKVVGQQWWWRFIYDTNGNGKFGFEEGDPDDVITANEVVIPTGREVVVVETSADVIHSFWIPALNGKRDAVPGVITEWKLQTDTPGVYMGQCTEFCGLSHGNMRMLVRAVPPADFQSWLEAEQRPAREPREGTPEAAGRDVFMSQLCSSCHLVRGLNDEKVADPEKGVQSLLVAGVAPDLTHFASRGTFAGAIFNRTYPNPDGVDAPFGQTCTAARASGGSGIGPDGNPVDEATLPDCPDANALNSAAIPYAANGPGNPDNPTDPAALRDWLRNPPYMKPMVGTPEEAADGKYRGMPNLNLSDQQINELVAYLNSLE